MMRHDDKDNDNDNDNDDKGKAMNVVTSTQNNFRRQIEGCTAEGISFVRHDFGCIHRDDTGTANVRQKMKTS